PWRPFDEPLFNLIALRPLHDRTPRALLRCLTQPRPLHPGCPWVRRLCLTHDRTDRTLGNTGVLRGAGGCSRGSVVRPLVVALPRGGGSAVCVMRRAGARVFRRVASLGGRPRLFPTANAGPRQGVKGDLRVGRRGVLAVVAPLEVTGGDAPAS